MLALISVVLECSSCSCSLCHCEPFSPLSASHRALLVPLDLRVLLDSVVWLVCLVKEEKEASLVFLAPL